VPLAEQRTVTACSWGSSKWAHWSDGEQVVLRASAGRAGADASLALDDAMLTALVLDDLTPVLGLRGDPTAVDVARWPRSFPQYAPGHLERAAAVTSSLDRDAPGVVAAGASHRGVGIPACIRQGREAAAALCARLSPGAG
jgi:oxygen-dependent protoporphyrinogen oxidase